MTTNYIFVTGGVVSSLGKGIAAASLAAILEARGLKVTMMKLDPYINVDPGTMSPTQHGEVFVTEDGAETSAVEGVDENAQAESEEEVADSNEIVMQEGETLADVKERLKREQAKAKKPTIPPELLNTANSYEDKVGVVRMVVQNDQSRVASVIRSMIQTQ